MSNLAISAKMRSSRATPSTLSGLDGCGSAWSSTMTTRTASKDFRLADGAWVCILLLACREGSALDVALTNDDGWRAEGIQSMYRELIAAGHTVTLAAPANEQSGSSASVNIGDLRVTREGDDRFSVYACLNSDCSSVAAAEPATSAMIAIDVATRRAQGRAPALLVSGINAGNNTGAATQISGTVGAAIAAISRPFNGQLPAVALSTDVPVSCKGASDCVRAHYEEVASFAVRLIDALAQHAKPGHGLLPPGIALNVNYPAETPRGVRLAVQGRSIPVGGVARDLSMRCETCLDVEVGDTALAGLAGMREDTSPDVPQSDAVSFAAGYITIVPIEADYTARSRRGLEWLGQLRFDASPVDASKRAAEE